MRRARAGWRGLGFEPSRNERRRRELRDALETTRTDTTERERGSGGEGGIRTHVPVTRQHAFEARPLRPLRYLSVEEDSVKRTFNYSARPQRAARSPHRCGALQTLSSRPEKALHQIAAFGLAHARDDLEPVILA